MSAPTLGVVKQRLDAHLSWRLPLGSICLRNGLSRHSQLTWLDSSQPRGQPR